MSVSIAEMRSGRVKLEFGNPDQIAAVRRQERIHDHIENSKLFEVTLSVSGTVTLQIRAKDEKEARRLAQDDGFEAADLDIDETSIDSIDEIEETEEEKAKAIKAAIEEAA